MKATLLASRYYLCEANVNGVFPWALSLYPCTSPIDAKLSALVRLHRDCEKRFGPGKLKLVSEGVFEWHATEFAISKHEGEKR